MTPHEAANALERPVLNVDDVLIWHGHDPSTVTEVRVTPTYLEVTHRLKRPEVTIHPPTKENDQ